MLAALLIGLRDIPKEKRRTEKDLLAEFEERKPEILGGILDTLSKALREYPSVNTNKLFRMADFTLWGCAIARALGEAEESFLNAYEVKVNAQTEEAAHSSPVATVLIDFMENHKEWEGSPSNLFKALTEHANDMGVSVRQKAWPKAPHTLTRHINELIPPLRALGVEVETGVRIGREGTRRIIMKSVRSVCSVSSEGKTDDTDATDTISPISSRQITFKGFELSGVVGCTAMQLLQVGECAYCGVKLATLTHSVKTFRDHHQICRDCATEILALLKKR